MDWSLGNILPTAARRYGDRRALVIKGREFTFRELERLSNRVASGLAKLGVKPGDRVTLYSLNSWEWVVSYYGVLKLGGVINPINVMLTPEEVAFVTNDCGARVLLTSPDRAEAILRIRDKTPLEHVIALAPSAPSGASSLEAVIGTGADAFAPVEVDPNGLSTICYTSGTTGHPKGAMLSHKAVMTSTMLTALMHVRTEQDTIVTALPCSHVYGNVVTNAAFLYGSTLVLHERFGEIEVMQSIQAQRATMLDGVPTMFMYLLAHPEAGKYDLSSLTRCSVGGQTMPVAKSREFETRFGAPVLELWGMTELAGPATCNPAYGENRPGSVGLALPGVECRIAAHDDARKTLGPGEVGELMVRGPLVMQGYYGNERATRETIEADGWMHTGDLARVDADGYFYVVDRKKDMIITGGFNVYPAELERVIAGHPAVALAAVGGVPDEMLGELAKAYVVLKPGSTAQEEEIIAFARAQLAAYKVPRAVQFVPDLPKTSTGKIMRRALKTLDRA